MRLVLVLSSEADTSSKLTEWPGVEAAWFTIYRYIFIYSPIDSCNLIYSSTKSFCYCCCFIIGCLIAPSLRVRLYAVYPFPASSVSPPAQSSSPESTLWRLIYVSDSFSNITSFTFFISSWFVVLRFSVFLRILYPLSISSINASLITCFCE